MQLGIGSNFKHGQDFFRVQSRREHFEKQESFSFYSLEQRENIW